MDILCYKMHIAREPKHRPMKTYLPNADPRLDRVFENLTNGNLSDAKLGARRFSTFRLGMFARQVLCWSFNRAISAAAYLKGEGSFQAYCDSEKE